MEPGQLETPEADDAQEQSVVDVDPKHGSQQTPAVGLVATQHNTGELVTEVLRATENGHTVFVTHPNCPDLESVKYAKRVGATIVEPPHPEPDREDLKTALITTAKTRSFLGLICNLDIDVAADYATSTIRLEESDQYCLERIPETAEQSEVIAAIPAFNEAITIADVVKEARQYADAVLVVDDGSADNTAALARDAGATVVEHETNKGYGAALKTIFREADKRNVEHLAIIDADGQHDPADIPELVEAQQDSDAEIVIGSRFTDDGSTNAPLYRRFGLFVVNMLTNLSFGVVRPRSWIGDTQSGFRSYDRQAIRSLAEDKEVGDRMSASTDILHHAHSQGYTVEEVGTTVNYDVEDASSQHPVSHGLTLVSNILKTVEQERPVTVLGVPGFLSSFVGLGFGYWTFSNYIASRTFPIGLALTSAVFGLAGIFACFTAIILHSLNRHMSVGRDN